MKISLALFFALASACLAASPELHPSFEKIHEQYVDRFVKSEGFGVKRIASMEDMVMSAGQFSLDGVAFRVTQMQLISLLKNNPPAVYETVLSRKGPPELRPVNEILKDKIKDYTVRPLTPEEQTALAGLKEGKNLVHIEGGMVGAIRATTSCLQCHKGQEGDLLGAFSYSVVREVERVPSLQKWP